MIRKTPNENVPHPRRGLAPLKARAFFASAVFVFLVYYGGELLTHMVQLANLLAQWHRYTTLCLGLLSAFFWGVSAAITMEVSEFGKSDEHIAERLRRTALWANFWAAVFSGMLAILASAASN